MEPSASQIVLPECDRCFRSAFAGAAIGVAISDESGAIVYANQALCRMLGYQEHELGRMQFGTGGSTNEHRLLREDGRTLWIRTIPIPSAHSQTITFVEDITERKMAEDALRASEERFRIAAENASDMIYEWDQRTGEVAIFGSAQHRLGDWPTPQSYAAWKGMVHPDDLERVLAESARHIQNGERYSDEYRIVGQNGQVYHYSNRGQAILSASGEPLKCVGLLSDITQIRLADEAISQLAAIVQCSEDAIVATDSSGAVTTWNDGAERLLGYSATEALALGIAALFASSDVGPEVLRQIRQGHASRPEEALFLRQDGSQVPVQLSISPIRKSDGRITGSAIIARDISARKRAERDMAHRAMHDHLTGLPNRLSLADGLAHSIAAADLDASGTAAVFVDLDGFKFVNDTLGHEAGDDLLQQVARRLSASVRHGDLLARMGGDEFMLVVNGVDDDQVALSLANRLAEALREPFLIARRELVITASMGISIYPRDGTDVSALCRNADAAMYEAKRAGKDRVRFYRPALGAAFQARLELEADLRRALDREELSLYYQPIFAAADNRQIAYEALSRWPHPALGFVPPSQFIPLAEETGLIVRLGEWVLRDACRQCRWWQDHGKPSVRVAVNVSALQFERADFVETVFSVLSDTGLGGNLLDLELTETIVMRDIDSASRTMARLRERGVRISVDDFGTGYSSLGYLHKLPIDTLKIDRCFVTNITENDAAERLIQGMISLAHSIGKRVIVEGVETTAQLEILRNLRCDEVQGFLLGRPEPFAGRDPRPQEIPAEQLIA